MKFLTCDNNITHLSVPSGAIVFDWLRMLIMSTRGGVVTWTTIKIKEPPLTRCIHNSPVGCDMLPDTCCVAAQCHKSRD